MTELERAIEALRKAVQEGNPERMHRCAYALGDLFNSEVPNPFEDFNSEFRFFQMAEVMVSYYMAIDQITLAGSLRNRVLAHYQYIRKSDEYSVPQKHELKDLYIKIKAQIPSAPRRLDNQIDKNSEKYKRFVFEFRAHKWFADIHGMLEKEAMEYLRPFNISLILSSLPLSMPREQVVEEITKYCYERGGSLAPRNLQRRYSIGGEPARCLYVIGNGFDLYHGAESGYINFRKYLFRRSPRTVGYFDLYFGPRSLDRSFSTPVGWFWCMMPYDYRHDEYNLRYPIATWSRSNLWCDFETNLSKLNREKVFDILDMCLPRVDVSEEDFKASQYFMPLDDISDAVRSCTFEMKYHFHRWVNTLHYRKGFRKRLLPLDSDAIFLNFNYTTFLESVYSIPSERICYIHGNRKGKFGSLVLGHHSDDKEAFEIWKHKNENRRRYRSVQKDAKGRYFRNDKLAYLAFFQNDDKTANWRLPIRYYAVENAEERLEKYYTENFKNTRSIIDANMGFFDSLTEVEKITVIGCSMGAVDMDYFTQLRKSVGNDVRWEFSYHTDSDEKRIDKFCRILSIDKENVTKFKL